MPKTVAILAPSSVPYQVGGAEKSWWGLREAFGALPDCQADIIKLPSREDSFAEIVGTYEMFSKLDLSHFDILITTKYPAWIAPHHNHVCYLYHALRGLYDTYHFYGLPETLPDVPRQLRDLVQLLRAENPGREELPLAFDLCRRALAAKSLPSALFELPGPLIREVVHFFDRVALAPGQIRTYFALSATVAARRDYFPPGVPLEILHLPPDRDDFFCQPGEYFFTASRINGPKRVRMIIDAMRHVQASVRLKIAGTGPDLENLRNYASSDLRIEFLGFVPDEALPELYAKAIAVPFVPYDEDYGLITVEAFKSGKPVVTFRDSGGVCELVRDGENGFVVEPNAPALGRALDRLAQNRELAATLGARGRESVAHLTWRRTAESLLIPPERSSLPKIVVACSFAADAAGHGGARRLYHFCRQLGQEFQVELVCIGGKTQNGVEHGAIAPNVLQTSLPWPQAALAEAETLIAKTGQSVDDIAIWRHANAPELVAALAEAGREAVGAIASHPWLYPALEAALPRLPIAYDAHNVEADLKIGLFGESSDLAADAGVAERDLARKAEFVFACSEKDASRLRQLYVLAIERLLVLPNGCEARGRRRDHAALRLRLDYPDAHLAVFMGSGHRPNVDAALALCRIAEELPQVQFLLAGTVSTQITVKNARRPGNLHLLGQVSEEVKNILLEAADIAVNPVASGSGVNLKMVEYLAFGIPCVSTPFGMRGLPDDLGQAVQICEIADFAAGIRNILANPPAQEFMSATASRIINRFAWQSALAPICSALSGWKSRTCA